jgi:translation elongation factor EF-1beta
MVMNLEMIPCVRCGNDTPKLRLEKYGYNFCVKCSDVKPKVGRIRVIGEGDYTVTELDILDQDTARRLQEMENTARGVRNVPLEILNYDEDEVTDDAKALDAVIEKALDDELEVEEVEEDLEDLEDVEDVELEDEDDD